MKKIDKILDMFDELLKTNVPIEDATFIVANSFYTSRDEKINRDTLLRYIRTQVDIEKFHKALEQRDLGILNPQRYSGKKISNTIFNEFNDKNIVNKKEIIPEKNIEDKIIFSKEKEISSTVLINEINSLKEKFEIFIKNYSKEKKILDIPKEMYTISENNIKRATFRVEENLLNGLEEFCKNHREFNKTLIINFMIKEFLENYKK